jgi:adenylate cyclase
VRAPRAAFDDELFFEILKSERLRARILMVVLGGLCLLALSVAFVLPREWNPIERLLGGRFPAAAIGLASGAAFVYELIAHTVLGQVIRRRIHIPAFPRYGNALVETSFPSLLLDVLSRAIEPELALNSPVPMLYFLFIILSTLRLSAPLSVFTGCVAGVEFLALGYVRLVPSGPRTFFTSMGPIVAKAWVMVVAGLVCGFVGVQIRRRLAAALHSLGEKNRVVGMFGQYVSPAVVDRLLQQPVDARGEVRHVTIMFLDIRDFTAFAERRTPEEVVDYLNTLFGALIALVNANHGIINKFLGDGFMACFGAPLSNGQDTQNAVRAAMAIADAVERMNATGVIPPTRIGMGLHAGDAVTGSVGSDERKEYTIIGDTVNLASRVEQLTKQYGAVLLVTDAVYRAVEGAYPARPIEPVTVKGRQHPVAIYALR